MTFTFQRDGFSVGFIISSRSKVTLRLRLSKTSYKRPSSVKSNDPNLLFLSPGFAHLHCVNIVGALYVYVSLCYFLGVYPSTITVFQHQLAVYSLPLRCFCSSY